MATRKSFESVTAIYPATVRTLTTWTADRIRAAELQADGGSYRLASDCCDWILTDDRVETLTTRVEALTGLTPTFEASGDKRRSNRAVKALDAQEDWWEGYSDAELTQLHIWGVLLGVSLARHYWDADEDHGGRLLPHPEWWPTQTLQQDQQTRKWSIADSTNQRHDVAAGDSEWILHTPYGKNRPHARGKWRALARWVLFKELARQDWSRHSEKASTLVASAPDGSTKDQRKQLAADLAEIGGDAVVALSPGYRLDLLEVEANTKAIYESQIELANKAISIIIRGSAQTTEVGDKGSRSAVEVQERKGDNVKLVWDANTLGATIHKQSLSWWAEFNYGDRRLAPWPSWPVKPEEDLKVKVETEEKSFDTVDKAEKLGFKVDRKKFLEQHKIDWAEEGERPKAPELPPGTPPVPGQPPADGEPPKDAPPPAPPADPKTPPKGKARASLDKLLALAKTRTSGHDDAQSYADELVQQGLDAAAPLLEQTLAAIEEELDAATSYDDLKTRLQARYETLDPHELADIVESVMVLGELAGRVGVNQDA
jgi:phage gp29-like protein